jgi:hypothetical protein
MRNRTGQKVLVSSKKKLFAVGVYIGQKETSETAKIELPNGEVLDLRSDEFEFAKERFPIQEKLFSNEIKARENMQSDPAQTKHALNSLVDMVVEKMHSISSLPSRVTINDVLSVEHAYLLQIPSILPLDDVFETIWDAIMYAASEVRPGYTGPVVGYLSLLTDQLKVKKGLPLTTGKEDNIRILSEMLFSK